MEEFNAGALSGAALREIERGLAVRGMSVTGGRAVIVNEAHGLRREIVRQLLFTLERIPSHVVWVFTSTVEGTDVFEDCDDATPHLSRCLRLDLSRRDLARPFAERCKAIAERKGLDGTLVERYVKLLHECRNKFRAALQAIEAGEMVT